MKFVEITTRSLEFLDVKRIVLRWMGGQGRPRVFRIPVWVLGVPLVLLAGLSLALWGLWNSPWSPSRLRGHVERLRQENLRLENQRERAEEGLQRAMASLEALKSERDSLEALAAVVRADDSTKSEDGFLQGFFRDHKVPRRNVQELLNRARRGREQWDVLISSLDRQPALAARLPTIRPVRADLPVVEGFVRARDPFTGQMLPPQGVAWGAPSGMPVWSTGAGQVIDVTNLARWGKTVEIDHGSGIRTLYCHLSMITVKVGDPVLRGQVIGLSGESGTALGPRVFYAVFQGSRARSPDDFILPELPGADTTEYRDPL